MEVRNYKDHKLFNTSTDEVNNVKSLELNTK